MNRNASTTENTNCSNRSLPFIYGDVLFTNAVHCSGASAPHTTAVEPTAMKRMHCLESAETYHVGAH